MLKNNCLLHCLVIGILLLQLLPVCFNNNTAYYFNPYTLKLEPILRDQYGFEVISSKENIQQWPPPYQFLMSLENSNKDYLTDFANNYKREISFIDEKFFDAKKLFPIDLYKKTYNRE